MSDGGRKIELRRLPSVESTDAGNGDGNFDLNNRDKFASGPKLWLMQVKGLVTKRMLQTKANWVMYLLLVRITLALTNFQTSKPCFHATQ